MTRPRKTTISGNPAPGASSMDVEPTASIALYRRQSSRGLPCLASRSTLAAALSTASEVGEPISDASCRLPCTHAGRSRPFLLQTEDPFSTAASTTMDSKIPKRLPSTSAPVKEPATHSPTSPSCDELPACVHPGSLSRTQARPPDERRLFTCADRGATCRSSTSAIKTTREHDRSNCSSPAHPAQSRPCVELLRQVAPH